MKDQEWLWRLIGNRLLLNEVGQVVFKIEVVEEELTARVLHIDDPDKILQDDLDEWQAEAVRVYLRKIGFKEPN